jgi:hypothetical protein
MQQLASAAVFCGVLLIGEFAFGQEVALLGRVTDQTDAVLPGVSVTAQHVDSGNTFTGVTDASGDYRLGSLRPGIYQVTAELSGFATITENNIELLLGQRAVINFKMQLRDVQETVTVTDVAPLIEVSQSKLGGNIDTRQMQALPLNGRNWMGLTMLAPGSRANSVDVSQMGQLAGFQLNLDGQQVTATQTYAGSIGQPKFSRDSIGEFELVSSRFDATQGRSIGTQVNAVTKAGTNEYSGSMAGYFRDDRFNAEDFIVHQVLPYSDQQLSATFGGPIRKDRTHFFGYYEHEREPYTLEYTSPYPSFNLPNQLVTHVNEMAGYRFDSVLTNDTRFMSRGSLWNFDNPAEKSPGATFSATSNNWDARRARSLFASITQAKGHKLNEIKGSWARYNYDMGLTTPAGPYIVLQNYTMGNYGYWIEHQDTFQVRDDFTFSHGSNDVKIGGELLMPRNYLWWNPFQYGFLDATLGPPPGNLEQLLPGIDPSKWNLAGLSSITRRYQQSVGTYNVHCVDGPSCHRTKPQLGAYLQDNWRPLSTLTLNLGVRWDFAKDQFCNDCVIPGLRGTEPQEWLKFGPRAGFAYSVADKTVLRGGWGLYYAGAEDTQSHTTQANEVFSIVDVENDGRPNFAADPFNLQGGGHIPTLAEALSAPHNVTLVMSDKARTPYAYQTSVGIQRQVLTTMSVQADYVWIAGRREEVTVGNENLSYNPATGRNYPFSDVSTRPMQNFGIVQMRETVGYSNYHAVETAWTKRFANRWQASATYTLSVSRSLTLPAPSVPFHVASYLGGEYGLSTGTNFAPPDQRNRAVFNGIVQLPYAFQVSGLYFFGSGQRFATSYGADIGDTGGRSNRLRPGGTILPYGGLVGKPLHRVDMRLQRRFRLAGRTAVEGLVEVFNVFNHANYGSYTTIEASPAYGQPSQNTSVEYQPRQLQLGFRFTF